MNAKILCHMGYEGSAEVSLEDNCLFGKILRIKDLVTYEADTVAQLRMAFTDAVDNYITHCREMGGEPDAPGSGTTGCQLA